MLIHLYQLNAQQNKSFDPQVYYKHIEHTLLVDKIVKFRSRITTNTFTKLNWNRNHDFEYLRHLMDAIIGSYVRRTSCCWLDLLAWLSSGVLHNSSQRWPTVYPVLPPGVKKAMLDKQKHSFMLLGLGEREVLTLVLFSPRRGVGRSSRYCKTRSTLGKVGASSWFLSQLQKSV